MTSPPTPFSLYRSFLRVAYRLPTTERKDWLIDRIRQDFRSPPSSDLEKSIKIGEAHLSNLLLRYEALSLYRKLFRAAKHMPTSNRAEFVRRKTRQSYEEDIEEANPEVVRQLINYGEFQLESVVAQASHLSTVFETPGFHNDKQPWDKPPGENTRGGLY
mmetsp:Transcript_15541/g.32032  ORF Transcript_15541/g.32032 Transcript_15541/m.32032 type:complete len:160 (-) Transcript_15541:8-487(-)